MSKWFKMCLLKLTLTMQAQQNWEHRESNHLIEQAPH